MIHRIIIIILLTYDIPFGKKDFKKIQNILNLESVTNNVNMRRRTYEIKCNECGRHLLKYIKYGDGNLVNCHKKRIIEDHTEKDGKDVKCPCGNVIGIDRSTRIKMKKHSYTIE